MNVTGRFIFTLLVLEIATGLQAGDTVNPAIVFCKTRIMPSGLLGDQILSVTLPPTPGYADRFGNPVTVWNPGNVTAGGVADSWHEGGPGYFSVRNTGNVEAYVYVVALSSDEADSQHRIYDRYGGVQFTTNNLSQTLFDLWDVAEILNPRPTPRAGVGEAGREWSYHLALTTDMTSVAPTWRPLDHALIPHSYPSPWQPGMGYWSCQCSAYLATVAVGDYQPFDLKFWAPPEELLPGSQGLSMCFIFTVEASSFPRWEHDR